MAYIYMYQFPEFMVKISSVVCIPTLAVEVSCPISMPLNIAALMQIALLQKESEIPVEELLRRYKKVGNAVQTISPVFRSQCRLLDAPPETLAASALALHYANVIIVIEKLAASPHLIELAEDWTEAMAAILEWLAPLAHNMIRWQSERSFEQQSFVSGTNALLVQTLYFANREKTEAAIIEILVGLNYVWRLGRELNAKALQECASSRSFDECLYL
ncbi:hypothetical protein V6Z12_D04G027000 [Gossypium hirsutum]